MAEPAGQAAVMPAPSVTDANHLPHDQPVVATAMGAGNGARAGDG